MRKEKNPAVLPNPLAHEKAVIQGERYRITLLTEQLIRLEYSQDGSFTDRPTQTVFNRAFPVPLYSAETRGDRLVLRTRFLRLVYDQGPFSREGLFIEVGGGHSLYSSTWRYGDAFETLKGTIRTLDRSEGEVPLAEGLLSKNGFSVLDDSASMTFTPKGWVEPPAAGRTDLYFFGYGRDYLACLRDFFRLSGPTPLLPRFALGNWWSRYHPYTEEEYRTLMLSFEKERIPLSVAVIDMDWHLTDIPPHFGSGWTGYTWNRGLFPDPAAFLSWLHERGLRTALNVHPAEGVRAYEAAYPAMAEALGRDPESGEKMDFDAADPAFMEAYFKYLHHPQEGLGVDFWWIDWQQQGGSSVKGLDPLWILNHYHFLDNQKNENRPLILSRYAGPGSHRYPIGFSGDTVITWESLAFQPYFTATASNVGFGWWSHDIGGHSHGIRDEELAVRWFQLGVFSPILRMHGSDNPFILKTPWHYGPVAARAIRFFLRFRHRLLPYLYSMNHRLAQEGVPLICPMYYFHPHEDEAYQVPNQYWFGDSLIACPITQAVDSVTGRGRFEAWLPPGSYYDIFCGRRYAGNRRVALHRTVEQMPVLAVAGSILPLVAQEYAGNSTENPSALELWVFAGADGSFLLREDNGKPADAMESVLTHLSYVEGTPALLRIRQGCEGKGVVPAGRTVQLKLFGFTGLQKAKAAWAGHSALCPVEALDNTYSVKLPAGVDLSDCLITLDTEGLAANASEQDLFAVLQDARIHHDLKWQAFHIIQREKSAAGRLLQLECLGLPPALFAALCEIIAAEA